MLDAPTGAFSPLSSGFDATDPIVRQFNVRSQPFQFDKDAPPSRADQYEGANVKLSPREKEYLHSLKGKARITSVSVITDSQLPNTSHDFSNVQQGETDSKARGFSFYDQHPLNDVANMSVRVS